MAKSRAHVFAPSLFALAVSACHPAPTPNASLGPVQLDAGQVAGLAEPGGVSSFHGVPFAAPPVGPLRWRAPEPVKPWNGVRRATQRSSICMQVDERRGVHRPLPVSEDCLYLNVWTGAASARERRPVMVWIHGGGFVGGTGAEAQSEGTHLAQKGVVLVSINYRLGPLGFLAHPELTAEAGGSGDYGLLDQIAALRWVQRNISGFGGDPGNVTIFGESAGSASVSALMASPLAKGLFQKAIGESGAEMGYEPPLRPATLAEAETSGRTFAKALRARSIADLRGRSAAELIRAPAPVWGPVVDGRVLPAPPEAMSRQARSSDVTLLVGWNADEGVEFTDRPNVEAMTRSRFEQLARTRFGAKAGAFLAAYPARTDAEARASFLALLGDEFIGYPTWLWLEGQRRTSKAPVYRYHFERGVPVPPTQTAWWPVAFHSGEILYVFDNLGAAPWAWTQGDRKLASLMSAYWINFAKSGDPNGPGLPSWPADAPGQPEVVFHFNQVSAAAKIAGSEALQFLDDSPEAKRPH